MELILPILILLLTIVYQYITLSCIETYSDFLVNDSRSCNVLKTASLISTDSSILSTGYIERRHPGAED